MLVKIAALSIAFGLLWPGLISHHSAPKVTPPPPSMQITEVRLNKNGGFTFEMGGREYAAITRISEPGSGWYSTAGRTSSAGGNETSFSTSQVDVTRTITTDGTHIEVHDQITNRSGGLVGIMVEDNLRTSSTPDQVWIAGRQFTTDKQMYHPDNPSVFGQWSNGGVGIVAVDDLMRAQGKLAYHAATGLRLLDDSLGIQGNSTVNLVWSVYPTPSGDYWDFVNAVRQDWNANFTLQGPFSYDPHFTEAEATSAKPVSYYGAWAKARGLKYMVNGSFERFSNGDIAHGTAITQADNLSMIKKVFSKIKAGSSTIPLLYFHAGISTEPDAEQKYSDSVAYKKNGTPYVYNNKQHLPLFLASPDTSYGKALKQTALQLIASPELGGLYWDEMSISYPENSSLGMLYNTVWDGTSVDISPTTHQITSQKTSVPLAEQPFILDILGKLRSAGKAIVANTQPFTKTMLDQHFPRFVEGKSSGDIASTNLGVPLVLANMKPEQTPGDAIKNAIEIVNQGAIYFGWIERWTPNTPDFNQLLFPITPVYLHPGTITGKERIITTKSGDFGWADGSQATVYVFDGDANQHTEIQPSFSGGKYHLNLPDGYLAILVKN